MIASKVFARKATTVQPGPSVPLVATLAPIRTTPLLSRATFALLVTTARRMRRRHRFAPLDTSVQKGQPLVLSFLAPTGHIPTGLDSPMFPSAASVILAGKFL